ncbi:MAG: SDR family NAD(P)-dependent oxidoreductase [Myxococcota bacterium]
MTRIADWVARHFTIELAAAGAKRKARVMRKIVVTGANKGIGKAIVQHALEFADDVFVYLGSRDTQRGHAAREDLLNRFPAAADRLELLTIDVASEDSVKAAAAACSGPLYALVNNAGIGFGTASLSEVLAVNADGVRRATDAFLQLLEPTNGRIVTVTSASGPMFVAECDPDRQRFFTSPDTDWQTLHAFMRECEAHDTGAAFAARGMNSTNSYGLSKACANTYIQWLAGQHPNLKINACTPGFIETDLTRPLADARGTTPAQMGMKSPEEATKAPLHLLFADLHGNGRYYGSDAVRSPLDRYRGPGDPPYTGT